MWADLEANFYGFSRQTSIPVPGLTCPVMLTAKENGIVSIKVTNTAGHSLTPNVKTEISTPLTYQESIDVIKILPGESAALKKEVGPENIDLGHFIFVDVLVYSAYPMPKEESMCGVFILPFNGSGAVYLTIGTFLSLLWVGFGLHFLRRIGLPKNIINPLQFIALLIVLGMAAGYLGWWLPTIFVFVVLILISAITLGNFAGLENPDFSK
jgi:hypothetical protein